MRFYIETKPLYLQTDASGIGLVTALLQTRDGMTCPRDTVPDNTILRLIPFASKSLTSAEQTHSNSKREALGILHGLERLHHYCFVREAYIITDHNPLIAIFKKATLLQRIQCILLRIHQFIRTGWLVTWNRQNIKPTQRTAEQYFQDQLQKHIKADPLGDILKQIEKQPCTIKINSISNGPFINNPTHKHSVPCKESDNSQRNKEENSGQRICENVVSVNRNIDHKSKDSDGSVRKRSGRTIRKPDKLAY